jgi:hypothetical protein
MELVTVDEVRPDSNFYTALEQGNIVLFARSPWDVPAADQDYLRGISQTDRAYHKNIAYRPESDKVTGFDPKGLDDPEKLRAVLRRFSQSALGFLRQFVPRYMEGCRIDYASFRGIEEEGRDLAFKKRNDLLHIDAFPTRPTGGDLILRTFVNIHPSRSRVWLTSDPFAPLAREYAVAAGWPRMASWEGLARLVTRRTAYDRFMLRFHDYLKRNDAYQQNCRKYRWEFPPGAVWMVFTDIVPHAVLSGQYALEQTVIVPRRNLLAPASAPVEILKSLRGAGLRPADRSN